MFVTSSTDRHVAGLVVAAGIALGLAIPTSAALRSARHSSGKSTQLPPPTAGPPAITPDPRPSQTSDTVGVSGGVVTTIKAGDDLQKALNAARPGDTLLLQAGATFTGPFTLPRKSGDGWITVQTTALNRLPGPGRRVTPAHGASMPKIVSPGVGEQALRTEAGAHHYRFIGIEFTKANDDAVVFDLVLLGEGKSVQDTLDKVPHHLILDRCYIHSTPNGAVQRCVALNSASTTITGCHISEAKGVGFDTQAICGWNGPGPYSITNNYLEGAGENLMLGGADPWIPGLVPSDVVIQGNTIAKPLAWRGQPWTIKNLLELKNARRVRIEGNILENNWAAAQQGYAVLFTPVNQDGKAPWCVVEQVEFVNNIVRHSGSGIQIRGRRETTKNANRIRIANNLFLDINGERWGGGGTFLQVSETDDLRIEHNTMMRSGNIIAAYDAPSPRFIFRNNLMAHGTYGIHGDGQGIGAATLNAYFPGCAFERNVIAGASTSLYPAGNFYPATIGEVGFIDPARGDYRLGSNSPYLNKATDGGPVGCNITALQAAVARAQP